MKHIVVGTAGHVDHGKTALVKALTGIDTDTLEEEKRRGLSIQPGFAPYHLPSGQEVAFVDVPGHERLVKNMVRGICGIDVATLVVAADDGVMPQTREHLNILNLLGIRQGLVVLSKIDLVDEELKEMAKEEIKEITAGSFLENALCVTFSARTLEGKQDLENALEKSCQTSLTKNAEGVFCLPIDRAFHMRGFGTVLTGTIASGKIGKKDWVEIYPSGKRDIVRSLEVHGDVLKEASAGQRVALNLPQVSFSEIQRGMVVGGVDALTSTHLLNAQFHYLTSQIKPLSNRTKVRFYTGASETNALMVFMDKEAVHPGETVFVQFRLLDKVTPLPFDRYIVRSLSPVTTIGGGIILEIESRKYRKWDEPKLQHLKLLIEATDDEILENIIKEETSSPIFIKDLSKKTRLGPKKLEQILTSLEEKRIILSLENDQFFHRGTYNTLRNQMLDIVREFHEANPLEPGISREDMRFSYLKHLDIRLFDFVIEELKKEKVILADDGIVCLADFKVSLSPKQQVIHSLIEQFAIQNQNILFTLKGFLSTLDNVNAGEVQNVISHLINTRELIFIKKPRLQKRHPLQKGAYIHKKSLEQVKQIVEQYVSKRGQISIHELKGLTGINCSRAGALLDYLDSIQFTVPVGENRILRRNGSKTAEPMSSSQ